MGRVKMSNFAQQKLNAWQPILSASSMLPVMIVIAVTFIPIGIGLLTTADKVKEKVITYSDHPNCQNCKVGLEERMKAGIPTQCNCSIDIHLDKKWPGDVYFGFGLTNFHQNHFRYINSRDNDQLFGRLNNQSVHKSCEPYDRDVNGTVIAPCGAIANGIFTDRFVLTSMNYDKVPMTHKNIAWESDRQVNFKNPGDDLPNAFEGINKPKYWQKNVYDLDEENEDNNGFLNSDFIIWMRVAAFPNFNKLYRVLDRTRAKFKNGLPGGDYVLTIYYNYPVEKFGGKKKFIMTTTSWMGGKNRAFGIGYLVVGCVCAFFGCIFLIIHMSERTQKLSYWKESSSSN